MYAEYLQAHGYKVTEAGTTDAAFGSIQHADIIITGLLVPGVVRPVQLIEHIKRETPNKPVIVVTACNDLTMHLDARNAGADAVLLKPCLPNKLLKEVQRWSAPGILNERR